MANQADVELMYYVQMQIRTGTKAIEIPAHLIEFATKEGLQEARALCKLSGVQIKAVVV